MQNCHILQHCITTLWSHIAILRQRIVIKRRRASPLTLGNEIGAVGNI